ncbi:xanthine dehydrogenase family protein molybdopterin-binding subunit [Nonomuraea sp. NPDC050536]|uniref:xanthine dehydrogenase family protein molybdopterin-binding subunit n=1 Tax=Nonomuraea sp. NPDC050536 TaxID=3364366 RepID=UPI0037C76A89
MEKQVGRSVPGGQAREIVSGKLEYVTDLRLPGMLQGAVLRSTVPHGRIVAIDTSAAARMPGVRAVITGADVPFNQLGPTEADGPVLADERVRQVGEAIALVAAVDAGTAKRAAEAIEVTIEPLPLVADPHAALDERSPRLHDGGNVAGSIGFASGDVERALGAAGLVVERAVGTGAQEHVAIEPPGGVARWESGQVTIWCGSQNPGLHRRKVARALAVELDDVRLIPGPVGGAFGARNDDPMPVFLALLARAAGAPVHLRMTREEVMVAGAKRHPFHTRIRLGVNRDGTFAASDMRALADTGPYITSGPNVLKTSAEMSVGPYRMPVARFDGQVVYTNNANAGAFRGYGVPQVAFALETAIDEAAAVLGLDPVEVRRRNLLRGGDRHGLYGHAVTAGLRAVETLEAAASDEWWTSREEWKRGARWPWRRGTGIALAIKGVGLGSGRGDAARARLIVDIHGNIRIWAGPNHTGQAIDVAYQQIAADILGLPPSRVTVTVGDTQLVPESGATAASRSMYAGGAAVAAVCRQYLEAVAADGGVGAAALVARGEAEFEATFVLPDVADPGMIEAERLGTYAPHLVYGCSAQVVRLEVNELTGEIRVEGVVCAVDCGTAINPGAVIGQAEGGVAQGLGLALMEEYRLDQGVPVTRSLETYLIPTVRDVPEIRTHLVSGDEPTGPMGAKGMAEVVIVPTGPAVAAAVADATGVRPDRLPITPERLLHHLANRSSQGPRGTTPQKPPPSSTGNGGGR